MQQGSVLLHLEHSVQIKSTVKTEQWFTTQHEKREDWRGYAKEITGKNEEQEGDS